MLLLRVVVGGSISTRDGLVQLLRCVRKICVSATYATSTSTTTAAAVARECRHLACQASDSLEVLLLCRKLCLHLLHHLWHALRGPECVLLSLCQLRRRHLLARRRRCQLPKL